MPDAPAGVRNLVSAIFYTNVKLQTPRDRHVAPRPQVRRHLLPQPDRPVRHPKPTPDPDQDHPGARRGGAPGGGPPLLGVRRVRWVRRPFRLDLGRFCRVAGPQTDRGAADSGLLF